MPIHVLILGANGQLGSDLVKVFNEKNIPYTPLIKSDFDVLTDDLSEKLLTQESITHIINCIAVTNVDGCETNSDLAFLINSDFSYKLAKLCNEKNIILFHISTDYVFDGTKTSEYFETDCPNPLNIYGLTKYAGDVAVRQYASKYFIFRVSSLFGKAGASGKGGNFITSMQRLGRERESLSVIADQITCPTATIDIARVIAHFIANNIQDYGLYNCVSANSCSWYDFAYEIFKLSNLDSHKLHKAEFASYKFVAKRPQFGAMSIKKLSKYYKMPTWQEALHEYFNV